MAKTKKDGFFKDNRVAPEGRRPQKNNFFKKKTEKRKPPKTKQEDLEQHSTSRDSFFRKTKPPKTEPEGQDQTSSSRDTFFRKTKPPKTEPEGQDQTSAGRGNFFKKKTGKNKKQQGDREQEQTPASTSATSDTKSASSKIEKKPFDKKLWRLRKYSNKYKLQQWEDTRKKAVLREYYKNTKNEKKFDVAGIYEKDEDMENDNNVNEDLNNENVNEDTNNEEVATSSTRKKSKAFKKAHLEFERIQDEKKRKKEEFLKAKAEREEAMRNYKKDKLEKFKKLNRKTKKGQPVMKYRMEMLLERIQKNVE